MKTQQTQIRLTALFALLLAMAISYAANAQDNVTHNVNSNSGKVFTRVQKTATDSITGNTIDWTGKGQEPIYRGANGGMYLARTSKKTGRYYRKYIKEEEIK